MIGTRELKRTTLIKTELFCAWFYNFNKLRIIFHFKGEIIQVIKWRQWAGIKSSVNDLNLHKPRFVKMKFVPLLAVICLSFCLIPECQSKSVESKCITILVFSDVHVTKYFLYSNFDFFFSLFFKLVSYCAKFKYFRLVRNHLYLY